MQYQRTRLLLLLLLNIVYYCYYYYYYFIFCVYICLWTTVYQQLEWCWFGDGLSLSFPHQLPTACFEWLFPFTSFKPSCWGGSTWLSTFSRLYPFIGHSGKACSCWDGKFMHGVYHQQRGCGQCPYSGVLWFDFYLISSWNKAQFTEYIALWIWETQIK